MPSRVEKTKRPAKAHGAQKTNDSATKTLSESTPTKSPGTNELRDVINALGGGDEDYELVKDIDSEDLEEFSDHEDDVSIHCSERRVYRVTLRTDRLKPPRTLLNSLKS